MPRGRSQPATARGTVSATARIVQLVHPQPVRLTEFHFSPLMQYRGEAENETVINSDDKLLPDAPARWWASFIVCHLLLLNFPRRNESWPRGRGPDCRSCDSSSRSCAHQRGAGATSRLVPAGRSFSLPRSVRAAPGSPRRPAICRAVAFRSDVCYRGADNED